MTTNAPGRAGSLLLALLAVGGPALGSGRPPKTGSAEPGMRTYSPPDHPPPEPAATPELMQMGERVYKGACLGCHGEKGDGEGREGKYLPIPPRNFTVGQFTLRTTPSGSLPRGTDLFRTIRRGIRPDIDMASFTFLSDREVWAVIAYVRTFSPRWKEEKPGEPVVIAEPPPQTRPMVEAGRKVFMDTGCFACHGEQGRGDGPAAAALTYDSGLPVKPANLTRPDWFKGGPTATDVYRTFITGMDGTPMPSFADSLSEEQRWQLVYFVLSLGKPETSAQK
ncbi:MAG TPA: c-type cytochrome [Myxococcales bacterium]|nr:c-type cytochrome [Myxococcales bacterium]